MTKPQTAETVLVEALAELLVHSDVRVVESSDLRMFEGASDRGVAICFYRPSWQFGEADGIADAIRAALSQPLPREGEWVTARFTEQVLTILHQLVKPECQDEDNAVADAVDEILTAANWPREGRQAVASISEEEGAALLNWNLLSDTQRDDIEAHVRALTEERPSYLMDKPPRLWRCFHCGEVFRTEEGARLHFGDKPTSEAACLAAASPPHDGRWEVEAAETQQFSGHTPGPWKWDNGIIPPDGPGRYADIYTDDGDLIIARFNENIPEGEANARLIAAAPDLLTRALKAERECDSRRKAIRAWIEVSKGKQDQLGAAEAQLAEAKGEVWNLTTLAADLEDRAEKTEAQRDRLQKRLDGLQMSFEAEGAARDKLQVQRDRLLEAVNALTVRHAREIASLQEMKARNDLTKYGEDRLACEVKFLAELSFLQPLSHGEGDADV